MPPAPSMTRRFIRELQVARFDLFAAAIGSLWLMLWLAPEIESSARLNPAIANYGEAAVTLIGAGIAFGLVAGHLWLSRSARVAMLLLLAAIAAATALGQASATLALLVAAGIVLHNFFGRYVPAVGIVTVGLLWCAGMAIPNPQLSFGHPIALGMTHIMAVAVLMHLYQSKRPKLTTETGVLIGVGWAFWILLGITLINMRRQTITLDHDHPWMWIGPMLALAVWITLAFIMVRRKAQAVRLRRVAVLWLLIYAAGWLFGAAMPGHAAIMLALATLGYILECARDHLLEQFDATPTVRV